MKTLVMAMMMIMGTATATFAKGNPSKKHNNKPAATMSVEKVTEAFTETIVKVPALVRFVKGDKYSFAVKSENKIVAESVKGAVKNGILSFSLANGLSIEEASDNDLTIVITAPGMPSFKTSREVKATEIECGICNKNDYTYHVH